MLLLIVSSSSKAMSEECVVLLHGLARSTNSMSAIERSLIDSGYTVVNQGYKSRSDTVEKLSVPAINAALTSCGEATSIHFVTHSMGGILLRYYLSQHTLSNLGRVVMLGPPNKGSQVVDRMGGWPGFKAINGPAGLQLGTSESSVPNAIGPAQFDLGIIAGTRSVNLLLSTQIPGADDGKVSVENTKLEGMNDHVTLPVTHTFMMKNKKVIAQVMHYLKHGVFKQDAPS